MSLVGSQTLDTNCPLGHTPQDLQVRSVKSVGALSSVNEVPSQSVKAWHVPAWSFLHPFRYWPAVHALASQAAHEDPSLSPKPVQPSFTYVLPVQVLPPISASYRLAQIEHEPALAVPQPLLW